MRQEQFGCAKNEEEEKLLAVNEYLKLELKLDTKTVERMEIEKLFYINKENPECLYVTFKHRSSVSRIFEKNIYHEEREQSEELHPQAVQRQSHTILGRLRSAELR